MQRQKRITTLVGIIIIIAVVIIAFGGVFAYQYYSKISNFQLPISNESSNVQNSNTDTASWKTYENKEYGFEFIYPEKLNYNFAYLYAPKTAINIQNINSNGCLVGDNDFSPNPAIEKEQITIGSLKFCVSESSDSGMGQLYRYYFYTTNKNKNYFTVIFTIKEPNGCGNFIDGPNYQPCKDFFNNYKETVEKPIYDSVSTFKFTK